MRDCTPSQHAYGGEVLECLPATGGHVEFLVLALLLIIVGLMIRYIIKDKKERGE